MHDRRSRVPREYLSFGNWMYAGVRNGGRGLRNSVGSIARGHKTGGYGRGHLHMCMECFKGKRKFSRWSFTMFLRFLCAYEGVVVRVVCVIWCGGGAGMRVFENDGGEIGCM